MCYVHNYSNMFKITGIFIVCLHRTREAMKGGMDFRQALALRLDLIRPSLQQLRGYMLSTKPLLTPYIK